MAERFIPQSDDGYPRAEVPDQSACPNDEHLDTGIETATNSVVNDEAYHQSPDPTLRMLAAEFALFGGSRPREDRPETPDGIHRRGHGYR